MNNFKFYLKKLFDLVSNSQASSVQIADHKRRKFLSQASKISLLSTYMCKCYASNADVVTYLPDMGDVDRKYLSPLEASVLGKQIILDIAQQGKFLDDYDVLNYLNYLGSQLVSFSPMAGAMFSFYFINDKEINAFALPGGFICVYNGLIYATQSEAELVAVLAHEISHIVQHHIFRNIANYQKEQWKSFAGVVAGALLATVNPAAGILAITGAQGYNMQNMLSFSRDYEREADRVGQKIMYNSGFDPRAMPAFFQRLYDTERFNDNEAYEFLRTHPVTSERLSEAEERARQYKTRMHVDSPSFLLIREKCRVRQIGSKDALQFYNQAIKNKKYVNLSAQYYGKAFANYLDKKFTAAIISLEQIVEPEYKNHPAVIALWARTYAQLNNFALANKFFIQGLSNFPHYKNLWLGQVELFIQFKKYKEANLLLTNLSQNYPNDNDIWEQIAQINSDAILNNNQKYYYALGNQQAILANYKVALENYLLALKSKNADPVLNDIISARIDDTRNNIKLWNN
ncbi:MAG: M48 family metalloprotease [Burkholderiales bacterium]|nr:M48 family metalloprotease [Burkholderiales bacterium]